MADEPMKPCKACGAQIPAAAKVCPLCHWKLKMTRCKLCGNPIPKRARYCSQCKSYQSRWSGLGFSATILALLTAVIGVTTPAINALNNFLDRNSHTSLTVNDVGNSAVQVYVWNTGRKPSKLVSARLDFGSIPVASVQLQPAEFANTVISPNGTVTITLKLDQELKRTDKRYTRDQILAMVSSKGLSLDYVIEESNGVRTPPKIPLSGERVYDLVAHNLEPDNG